MTKTLFVDRLDSPVGPLLVVTDGATPHGLFFGDREERMARQLKACHGRVELRDGPAPLPILKALRAYFAGDLAALDAVPVETGGTAFQRAVWAALRTIRPGTTASYGELARRLGRPSASRAVGLANALNPISLVVPCHRVIGASGALTGYAGGLAQKEWLLRHEGITLPFAPKRLAS